MGVTSGPKIYSESREEGGVLLIHSDTTDGSTTFVDSSPSKRAITTGGAVHHDSANAISKFGATSIYFDGSGDFLKIASSSDWAFTGDFTIDLWVYPQDTDSGNLVGDYYIGGSSTSPDWQFNYVGSNEKVNFWRGSSKATSSNNSVPRNQWTHVALVKSGTGTNNCKIYINGVLDGQGTQTGTVGRGLNLWVGIDGDESSEAYLGYMDEIRISNTARWTENFKPPHRRYVTRDLVLCLDAMNAKSFAGEPTSNLCTSRISDGAIAFTATGNNASLGLTAASDTTETPFGNTAYKLTFAAGGSYGTGYTNERAYTGNWTVDRAKTYSYGIWIAFNNDYAKYRFEVAGTIYGYITGGNGMANFHGFPATTYIDAGGKRWYHYGRTAQTIGSSGTANEFWVIFRNASTYSEECTLWVAGPQFEEGSSFTPYTSTSRAVANSWKDLSGNENHGTHSAENFGDAGDVSLYRKGQIMLPVGTTNITGDPASINFDGTNDIVTTSFGSGRNVLTHPITVCAWVKADVNTTGTMWLDVGGNGSNQRFYIAFIDAVSPNNFGIQSQAWGYTSSPGSDTTKWYHQALVMDHGTARAYYDANEGGTKGYSSYTLPGNIQFGGRNTGSYNFNGRIACVAIYSAALTHAQIKQIYNAQRSRFGL